MTTQEKNIEINVMLGSDFINEYILPINGYHYPSNDELKFDTDANWQFEAIDWIEKQGMDVSIIGNECAIIDIKKHTQKKILLILNQFVLVKGYLKKKQYLRLYTSSLNT